VPDPLPEGSLFGESNAGQILWATQNWMSVKALLVAFIGWRVLRRRYTGQVTFVILVAYGVLRYAVECFRGDAIRGVWFGGRLSTSQIVSIAAVLFGLADAVAVAWPPRPAARRAPRAQAGGQDERADRPGQIV
jgi:hypothetical protein